MSATMLVRTAAGAWESLEPLTKLPEGGITELLGEDIAPVLGQQAPLVVVAAAPKLATGRPDAICLDAEGNITVVVAALTGSADRTLPALLSFAGSLHGMAFDDFAKLCNRAIASEQGSLAEYVHAHNLHAEFHKGTFEVTVADALAQGRFHLVALVASATPSLAQSMRYLNSSGADVGCFEVTSFASDSVTAIQAGLVDVGQVRREAVIRMSAAGLLAITERNHGEQMARLMALLQKFGASTFDAVAYDGDNTRASMTATINGADPELPFLVADTEGAIGISFETLAPLDRDWSVRAGLCKALNRMLGADLGDVRKISQLNLSIREHLMDATLMDAFTEILADTVQLVRGDAARSGNSRNGVATPA